MAYSQNNRDFFFLGDIFVLNVPFSSPKVRASSLGGKHWTVFFPTLIRTQTCLLALNGTLCASLLVFKRRHMETRVGPVLQREGFAWYLPKSWIHWGLEWNRKPCPTPVLRRSGYIHAGSKENSLPGSRLGFPFSWPALLLLLWVNKTNYNFKIFWKG